MCNHYRSTATQHAMRELVKAMRDITGNLEPTLDLYPDRPAPIVRNAPDGVRELAMVRWGMPSSQKALFDAATRRADKLRAKGKEVDFGALLEMEPDGGTTNVRNTVNAKGQINKHWGRWLGIENRCVVPWTRFAEFDKAAKRETWFALDASEPPAWFAGIYVSNWTSVRKIKTGMETIDLFGFLTTDPNAEVKPIHQNAMPVILRTEDEIEAWLTLPWEEAKVLQRPLPDGSLTILGAP